MSGVSKVPELSVELTPETMDLVQQAVASGAYASGSEVVREAVREWTQRRAPKFREPDEVRRLWAEGLASGSGRLGSMEDIKQEARRRLAVDPPLPAAT